jgi:hypothetical protein
MKKILFLIVLLNLCICNTLRAQAWYYNPLGFSPLELEAKNGFLLPAIAVGLCVLVTKHDTALANRLSFYNEGGTSWGYKYPYTTLYQNNTGINYHLRKWMSVGFELSVYVPRDSVNSTIGFAARPFARFYVFNKKKWRVYFESGVGIIYFTNRFPLPTTQDPRLGTHLNFDPKYGLGAEVNLDPKTSLLFGIRHAHVSNGDLDGVQRNPSFDSDGFFIGFSYQLVKSN